MRNYNDELNQHVRAHWKALASAAVDAADQYAPENNGSPPPINYRPGYLLIGEDVSEMKAWMARCNDAGRLTVNVKGKYTGPLHLAWIGLPDEGHNESSDLECAASNAAAAEMWVTAALATPGGIVWNTYSKVNDLSPFDAADQHGTIRGPFAPVNFN